MKKKKMMCVALILLGSIPLSQVWAGRGHGHHGHHGHHNHGGHHRHGHHHHGGGFGGYGLALGMGVLGYGLGHLSSRAPYYPPSYGYPPAAYRPSYGYAPVFAPPVVAAPPPAYIQREVVQVPAQAQASNYWHYCRKPDGYYPYVKNCPEGWLQVAPQPPQ